jgi:hypothetical protein
VADRDALACGAVPAVAPGSGGAASTAAHAAIQAAIPLAASTPSPCRHPPLPLAAAARSSSYRPMDAAGAGRAAPPAWSAAFGVVLPGLSRAGGPGGPAAAQRAFC